ncbi:hypothetical protein FSARC_13262 [Fusarium sarcochroum]|uniref:Transposase n=1 Tax=Fusarium sarcochroum TaxID=1208366 RepID=A0A8H4T2S2_9HYPO|nr:hypothetical protein FSARC_13262 [Fusarium sarcochroum]
MSDMLEPWRAVKLSGLALSIFVVTIVFTVLCFIVVCLRVWIRQRASSFGRDDWLMVAGTVLNLVHNGFVMWGTITGIGTPDSRLNGATMVEGAKAIFFWQIFYVSGSVFIKASICVQLMRIATDQWMIRFLWALIAISVTITIIAISAVLFRCKPIDGSWNPALGTCADQEIIIRLTYVVSVANILTDWSVALIPIFILWNLQMAKKLKKMAALVMGVGVLASIATIVRMPYSSVYSEPENLLYGVGHIILWTVVECSLGIIAGSMPILRKLIAGLSNDESSYSRDFNNYNLETIGQRPTRPCQANDVQFETTVAAGEDFESGGDNESTKRIINVKRSVEQTSTDKAFDRQIPHRSLPCFLVFVFDNDMKMPRSRLRWKYTEDDVAEAILDVTDNGFSPPQAAHRRGVPRRTLIDRLHGRGAVKEQIHPHRRLSKRQEDRLAFWILRQESLGYAPSHSQIRACVMGLLRQQGEHPKLGRNWMIKFINRRAHLKTKMGRRQEAKRIDSFTPKAVHWCFDIRDGQYGWIKPENTGNIDEGGIMTGFGNADLKRKAFLKGPQTRNWTSFIEAVTADGRALVPGIIFKGKELQKQWFLEEFKQIADWYYITSPNGWTDDHIGIEWLERVYLPQNTPADESDARLIIVDGHGSHATPLYNGVFNALKAAYRRELERFASLTDSTPMDKVNFIRAYAKARRVGMTKKNILSGWRVTGNWPISRVKALRHPDIQQDRPNGSPRVTPEPRPYLGLDDTPQTSRQIRDLGLNKTSKTRRRYNVISKGFEAHQQTVAAHTQRIASLEEELDRLKRGKKRKAVPNPNKRFMTLGETIAGKESIPEGATPYTPVGVEFISSSEQESASEAGSGYASTVIAMV